MNRAESNETIMKQFEIMINTADEALSQRLISEKASFFTPASPVPLYGGKGYLSVVHWMRQGCGGRYDWNPARHRGFNTMKAKAKVKSLT